VIIVIHTASAGQSGNCQLNCV